MTSTATTDDNINQEWSPEWTQRHQMFEDIIYKQLESGLYCFLFRFEGALYTKVGYTDRTLMERMKEHKYTYRNHRMVHFIPTMQGKDIEDKFFATDFAVAHKKSITLRSSRTQRTTQTEETLLISPDCTVDRVIAVMTKTASDFNKPEQLKLATETQITKRMKEMTKCLSLILNICKESNSSDTFIEALIESLMATTLNEKTVRAAAASVASASTNEATLHKPQEDSPQQSRETQEQPQKLEHAEVPQETQEQPQELEHEEVPQEMQEQPQELDTAPVSESESETTVSQPVIVTTLDPYTWYMTCTAQDYFSKGIHVYEMFPKFAQWYKERTGTKCPLTKNAFSNKLRERNVPLQTFRRQSNSLLGVAARRFFS